MPALSRNLRHVVAFNEVGLCLACQVRAQECPSIMLLLNPTGAMRSESPMNVAALSDTGALLWALPLDCRRLSLEPTTRVVATEFEGIWQLIDEGLEAEPREGRIWLVRPPVGEPPDPRCTQDWLEYDGGPGSDIHARRPWLEIAHVDDLTLVAPLCGHGAEKRWRAPIKGEWIGKETPSLRCEDGFVDIAHFALLDPERERWPSPQSSLSAEGVESVRSHVWNWPQRTAWRVDIA